MQNKYKVMGMMAAITAVVMVLGGLALSLMTNATQAVAQTQTEGRTITVIGEGIVKAKPDIAQANIGVQIRASDPVQATTDAGALMEKLMDALKAQGVAESDIQTSYYNLWVDRPYNPDGSQSTEAVYQVSNTLQVTIRDLTKLTTILGAAIEAGANTVDSVTFNLADPATLRSAARQKAVADAEAKAAELATLNGVQVGEVVRVSEVINSGIPYAAMDRLAQGGGGVGPIVPGEVEVSVQLEVAYAIQ